ncbi:MAG: helix-turn-helix transcriptional regulator [Candidatus Omnitrophica bacterium]|nr:helix-turn-helix transcriptional regulator [Candidatus Omnitrophota bacterium]
MSIRLRVGKKIRELRKKCRLTQEKLAELAEIDYKYLQRIEGKKPPNIKLETIAKLAKTLKVSPSALLEP